MSVRRVTRHSRKLIAIGVVAVLAAAVVAWGMHVAKRDALLRKCISNNHQVWLAMKSYHHEHGVWPGGAIRNKGIATYSWRIALLPYLGEKELFRQYRLDEPWNSLHNRKLVEKIPSCFRCISMSPNDGETTCVAILESLETEDAPIGVPIPGYSDRILFAQIPNSGILWTEPRDTTLQGIGESVDKGGTAIFATSREPAVRPKEFGAHSAREISEGSNAAIREFVICASPD